MDKVISLIESLKTIFYFKNFEFGKTGFDSNQVGMDLNYFELQSCPLVILSPSILQLGPTPGASPHALSLLSLPLRPPCATRRCCPRAAAA
jgi:hypothetical protein